MQVLLTDPSREPIRLPRCPTDSSSEPAAAISGLPVSEQGFAKMFIGGLGNASESTTVVAGAACVFVEDAVDARSSNAEAPCDLSRADACCTE